MWKWQLLRAGTLRLDGGGMFGVIPKTIWSRLVTPDKHNRIPLQTNCLLLRDGSHTVLVETGCGDKWTDTQRGHWDLIGRHAGLVVDTRNAMAGVDKPRARIVKA